MKSNRMVIVGVVMLLGWAACLGCHTKKEIPADFAVDPLDKEPASIDEVVKTYSDDSGNITSLLFYHVRLGPQLSVREERFNHVREIEFQECRLLPRELLEGFQFLPELRSVSILNSETTDEVIRGLAGAKQITSLEIVNAKITGTSLGALANVPLERVHLQGMELTTAGANLLAKIPTLKSVILDSPRIVVAELTDLAEHPGLEEFDAGSCQLGKDWLPTLKKFSRLKKLRFPANEVDDQALADLVAMTTLEDLDLSGSQITGEGLKTLANMPALRRIVLADCQGITDENLGMIVASPTIEHLVLSDSGVTGAGLEVLAKMKQLKYVELLQNQVGQNRRAIAALREALPECEIMIVEDLAG